jgi:hypothetical protein
MTPTSDPPKGEPFRCMLPTGRGRRQPKQQDPASRTASYERPAERQAAVADLDADETIVVAPPASGDAGGLPLIMTRHAPRVHLRKVD